MPFNPHHPRKCLPVSHKHSKSFALYSKLLTDFHLRIPLVAPLSSKWVRPPRPVHLQESEMSTLRQIDANRRNAQKSTGPTSVTRKAVSSMNALKTGIQ